MRVGGADFFEERRERALVFCLERLAAQDGQPGDVVGCERVQDLALGFRRELPAEREVPGLPVLAALAVVAAAGDEQGDAHAKSVRNVEFFYRSVVHIVYASLSAAPRSYSTFPRRLMWSFSSGLLSFAKMDMSTR